MSFFGELRRRNVFKVGAAYVIVAWLVLQVASIVVPAYQAPDWLMPILIALLALGFPVALVFAWAYELTPEGLRPSADVERSASIARQTSQRLNYLIIGTLATALVLVVVDQYVLEDRAPAAPAASAAPAADLDDGPAARAVREAVSSVLPNSVAVLPFDNFSTNADDAYFAEGMHEEVLNQLNKLSRLTVIGGTTMRQYRGTQKSIGQIGDELNVEELAAAR